jgi:hypothetical protein
MTLNDFFRLIVPESGVYCCAAIQGKVVEHVFLDNVDEIPPISDAAEDGVNMYFAPAAFKEHGTRTQANVRKLKAFWLDIDAGKDNDAKSYTTQDEAIAAIRAFLEKTELPEPVWVNTGNGVHLYWPLNRELDPEVWKPIATRLQALTAKHGLKVDTSCTTDTARILRFPNTFNYRDPANPKPTSIITEGQYAPVKLLDFAAKLGLGAKKEEPTEQSSTQGGSEPVTDAAEDSDELPFDIPEYVKHIDDTTTKSIAGVTIFKNIMARSDSCNQLKNIMASRAILSEPLWRAGLSIAQICEDREEAIREVSIDHPEYSKSGSERKASQTNGPYTCAAFEKLNPEGCAGCPHRGKLSTPAQLGKYVAPAVTEEERTVETVEVVAITSDGESRPVATLKSTVIPEYPSPYFRPKGGTGVHKTIKIPGEPDTSVQICEYDFYVTRRMHDPDVGEVLWFRVHLPLDGIREFSIPLMDIASRDKFRDCLAMHGLMTTDAKQVSEYMHYIKKWLRHLQMTKQAEKVRSQMGWTDERTFVVGTREMIPGQPEGSDIIYAPPAVKNMNLVPALSERGDFHKWKEVINFYANEGMEPYAFALFLSFGAPLMQFTSLRGGVYNLVSEQSGIGKSSALLAANSIWGHPMDLLLQKDDTYNARIHRAGVMRHLPVTIDEITNMKPLEMSDQVYASTSGRGKNRMETHHNMERLNQTSWQTPTLTTSNSTISDKLFLAKSCPEGELMRVVEVEVTRNTSYPKSYTDMLFPQLEKNYGMAWVPYMRYVLNKEFEVRKMLTNIQQKMDTAANLTQRERIWSVIGAIGITGGTIASSLGLHNIPVERVAKWVAAMMFDASKNLAPNKNRAEEAISNYIAENYANLLMIRNEPEPGSMGVIPIVEPRNELKIRCEPDTRRIFIATLGFKQWCAKNQTSFTSLVNNLKEHGIHVEVVKKRMAKGTELMLPPVATLMIQIPDSIGSSVFGLDEMDQIDAEKKEATLKALG